jgi:para-aminobenzoate synthetase component I
VKQYGKKFPLNNTKDFKSKMLNWASRFSIFCLLDNQQYHFEEPSFECLFAVGCKKNIELSCGTAFEELSAFYTNAEGQWLFGHLGYDLKNEVEKLRSDNIDNIGFADTHFFIPEIVLRLNENTVEIFCDGDAGSIFDAIQHTVDAVTGDSKPVNIASRISKADYITTVKKLQQHILHGDCYEINFCQEFFAEEAIIDPVQLYRKLAALSPNPFAALYKVNNRFCICASPERYLKKEGIRILSQPIKGTSKRDLQNSETDLDNKNSLAISAKERSENVMVVDLVRNDLSKICKEGTVKVDELFGVYSFPQVHQMISTVSGELNDNTSWVDAVKATFPMGSMTGAPKKRVMELIEENEQTRRGLFSGAIGYINPEGDFDFNVVIRSMFYNAGTKYLSFQTGSAITFYCDAEKEYEECLLKAAAIKSVLE